MEIERESVSSHELGETESRERSARSGENLMMELSDTWRGCLVCTLVHTVRDAGPR